MNKILLYPITLLKVVGKNPLFTFFFIMFFLINSVSFTVPPDKLKFKTMVWDKSVFLPYATNSDFNHFIFQVDNKANTNRRQVYELVVYAFNNSDVIMTPSILNTMIPRTTVKEHDIAVQFGNLILTQADLLLLIPNNNNYQYLRFVPIPNPTNPTYVSYNVFPVLADGTTPAENTSAGGIKPMIKIVPIRMDPSPPAPRS